MIKALPTSLLTSPVQQVLSKRYRYAREQRQMGWVTATAYVILVVLAYSVLRLEGPAWRALRQKYAPWFTHIEQRPYKPADGLRYGLQAAWLLIRRPIPLQDEGYLYRTLRAGGRKLARGRLWVHHALGTKTTPLFKNRFFSQDKQGAKTTAHAQSETKSASQIIFWLLGGSALFALSLLLITQPFGLAAQFVFVFLLWSAAMIIRRVPGRFSSLLLIVLSLTVSGRYIWWRYTSTLNWGDSKDAMFGLILLSAETYSWIVLVLGYIQTAWPLRRPVASLPADTSLWPTVDLMIPTYNEDLSVVKPTVYAALGMDWPKDKLRIHLLDDGRRELFRDFAEEVGINYIIRPDGRHAKAGNLNHALTKTDGDLVAIFDCDHIPSRSFLQLTVGWFLKDEKLALVQTPHHFFSPDPFERNLGHFGKQPNENTLFYGLIQDGNDLWNAAFFCGSCAVLRREAVESIGGFAVETVTEDAHTALRLHRKGYNSAYLRIPMAAGLATESLSAHIGQRIRWARGMVQIFRTDNPLFGKGLTIFQRLCYLNAMVHFLAGIPRIIYLTAPLAFLLFHSYIIYAPALVIMLYVLPHMIHANLTNSIMQGAYRRTFWGEVYETVLSWYIARPTAVALFAPNKGTFNVTAKGGLIKEGYFDWKIATPYVVLALLNLLGFAFGIWRLIFGPSDEIITVVVTMLWVVYNLVILGGAVAVAAEVRQTRHSHRVAAALPVDVRGADGRVYGATLSDYSESGVGLSLNGTTPFKPGDTLSLLLSRGGRQFSFPVRVTRSMGNHIGAQLDNLTQQQQIDFVQCTFARADAWLTAGNNFSLDKPLESFTDVALLSLKGYKRLAQYLPFPLGILFSGLSNSLLWIGSFIPRTRPSEKS